MAVQTVYGRGRGVASVHILMRGWPHVLRDFLPCKGRLVDLIPGLCLHESLTLWPLIPPHPHPGPAVNFTCSLLVWYDTAHPLRTVYIHSFSKQCIDGRYYGGPVSDWRLFPSSANSFLFIYSSLFNSAVSNSDKIASYNEITVNNKLKG
jgi:hypothetical protein